MVRERRSAATWLESMTFYCESVSGPIFPLRRILR